MRAALDDKIKPVEKIFCMGRSKYPIYIGFVCRHQPALEECYGTFPVTSYSQHDFATYVVMVFTLANF